MVSKMKKKIMPLGFAQYPADLLGGHPDSVPPAGPARVDKKEGSKQASQPGPGALQAGLPVA